MGKFKDLLDNLEGLSPTLEPSQEFLFHTMSDWQKLKGDNKLEQRFGYKQVNLEKEIQFPVIKEIVNVQEKRISAYKIFILLPISDHGKNLRTHQYFLQILMSAPEDTDIDIYIHSPGGNVATTFAMLSAIESSRANVTCHVIGNCMSAATLVFQACMPNVVVYDNAVFMFHTPSTRIQGKTSNIVDTSSEMLKRINKLLHTFLEEGILTEKEYDDVQKHKDVFLSGKTISNRIRNASMENLEESLEDEISFNLETSDKFVNNIYSQIESEELNMPMSDTTGNPKDPKDTKFVDITTAGFSIIQKGNHCNVLIESSASLLHYDATTLNYAFLIWLLTRQSNEHITFMSTSYELIDHHLVSRSMSNYTNACYLDVVRYGDFKTTYKVTTLTSGYLSLLALVCDNLEIESSGALHLKGFVNTRGDLESQILEKNLNSIYIEAKEKGKLTEEELDKLLNTSDIVVITKEMLIERQDDKGKTILDDDEDMPLDEDDVQKSEDDVQKSEDEIEDEIEKEEEEVEEDAKKHEKDEPPINDDTEEESTEEEDINLEHQSILNTFFR